MKNNFFIALVLLIGLFYCKPKETPKPAAPIDNTKVIKRDSAVVIKNIQLYNQGLFDSTKFTGYKFYSITQKKYFNSLNGPIELAFGYNVAKEKTAKHVLGCAKNVYLRSLHGIPNTNNTKVDFYSINNDGSTLIYDTITFSNSFDNLFKTYFVLSNVDGESDALQSDGFGWDINQLIGFKLSNGKRGLIKVITTPSGSVDNNKNVISGSIKFDIKLEK